MAELLFVFRKHLARIFYYRNKVAMMPSFVESDAIFNQIKRLFLPSLDIFAPMTYGQKYAIKNPMAEQR